MKTLILYQSKTGNTAKYAEDIAKRVNADAFELNHFKPKKMKDYDTIVFGGWVMAGNIQGINKFLQHWDEIENKNVIVFSVGMSLPSKEGRTTLINQNLLDMYHIRFYQLRGSFDFNKLGPIQKLLIKNSVGRMTDENDSSDPQAGLESIITRPILCYDTEKIDRMVSVLENLALEAK